MSPERELTRADLLAALQPGGWDPAAAGQDLLCPRSRRPPQNNGRFPRSVQPHINYPLPHNAYKYSIKLTRVTSEPHNTRKTFPYPPPLPGHSLACRALGGVGEHGLEKQHLPGRNSSESKTIVNVTQSQSCRLAVVWGPLLPIPIHSVRMEFLDCFSSTLRLREIRQKFVFLPKRCHSKGPLSSGRLYEGGV